MRLLKVMVIHFRDRIRKTQRVIALAFSALVFSTVAQGSDSLQGYVLTRTNLTPARISGLTWSSNEFRVLRERLAGNDQYYAILTGKYPKKDFDLYAENRPVIRTPAGDFSFKVAAKTKPSEIHLRAVGPNGNLETEEILLIKIPKVVSDEEIEENERNPDTAIHGPQFSASFYIGFPLGNYTSTSNNLGTTTQQFANSYEGGLAVSYFNAESESAKSLEYEVSGKIGSITYSNVKLPLNYELGAQVQLRNFAYSKACTIAPLLKFQYEFLSISSLTPTFQGLEANEIHTSWIGAGFKFTFPNLLGMEIVPSYSIAAQSNSTLSTTGTPFHYSGSKIEVGLRMGETLFLGSNLLVLNLTSGAAQVTGFVVDALVGLRF